MNFYIGNSLEEISIDDFNVDVSDELINFIFKLRQETPVDMSKLYEIDPYDDIEISAHNLSEIIYICAYILENSLLEKYEDKKEGEQMLKKLKEIAIKANKNGMGLVSLGD